MTEWIMQLRFRRMLREGDKGGNAGAAGTVEAPAGNSVAGEGVVSTEGGSETDAETDAFHEALGIPSALLATLKVKPEKKAEATAKDEAKEKKTDETPVKKGDDDGDEFEVPAEHVALPHVTKMKGRIDKLTRQKHELREQLEEATAAQTKLQQQLESASARTSTAPATDDAFAGIETAEQLTELVGNAEATVEWAEGIAAQWEEAGGEAEITVKHGDGKTQTLKPSEVKAIKRNAEKVLRGRADAEKRLAARSYFDGQAVTHYPWMKDEKDARQAFVKAAFEKVPGLRSVNDGRFLAAILAEGMAALQTKIAAEKKAAESAKAGAGGKTEEVKGKIEVAPPPPSLGAGGAPKVGAAKAAGVDKAKEDALAGVPAGGFDEQSLADYYRTQG